MAKAKLSKESSDDIKRSIRNGTAKRSVANKLLGINKAKTKKTKKK